MREKDELVIELFLERASEDGNHTALVLESGERFSYAQLLSKNAIALIFFI